MKKTFLIISIFFSPFILSVANASSESCEVVDHSWSTNPFYCSTHGYGDTMPYRCYAEVKVGNKKFKVFGGCAATPYDCSYGEGKVDACD